MRCVCAPRFPRAGQRALARLEVFALSELLGAPAAAAGPSAGKPLVAFPKIYGLSFGVVATAGPDPMATFVPWLTDANHLQRYSTGGLAAIGSPSLTPHLIADTQSCLLSADQRCCSTSARKPRLAIIHFPPTGRESTERAQDRQAQISTTTGLPVAVSRLATRPMKERGVSRIVSTSSKCASTTATSALRLRRRSTSICACHGAECHGPLFSMSCERRSTRSFYPRSETIGEHVHQRGESR